MCLLGCLSVYINVTGTLLCYTATRFLLADKVIHHRTLFMNGKCWPQNIVSRYSPNTVVSYERKNIFGGPLASRTDLLFLILVEYLTWTSILLKVSSRQHNRWQGSIPVCLSQITFTLVPYMNLHSLNTNSSCRELHAEWYASFDDKKFFEKKGKSDLSNTV